MWPYKIFRCPRRGCKLIYLNVASELSRSVAAIAYIRIPPAFWASKTFPEIAADALVPLHRGWYLEFRIYIDKLPYRENCRYFGTYHMHTSYRQPNHKLNMIRCTSYEVYYIVRSNKNAIQLIDSLLGIHI